MDKKVIIFFSLFGLLMIGGSFVLSLWVLPKILPTNNTLGWGFEVVKSDSKSVTSVMGYGIRNENKVLWGLMISQMAVTICIVLLVGVRLKKWVALNRPITPQGYIFKITRITGKSAYDVFCKAAEDWPVAEEQIMQDFRRYLSDDRVPYYVNDFIRKNKKHIDEIRASIFQFHL